MRSRVLNRYRAGTTIEHAAALLVFDRRPRMLVLEGIERIKISFGMQVGYVLDRHAPAGQRTGVSVIF
ncbi:hypothetical protein E3O11_06250 [Cryobacterium levicorallinum]|uniref:Uncharacterized protein n=1 Tax=Cryobacterium levicorallinum TaxID=995038 RepID=A0A4R8VNN4_9MICO|nr:hypothetical protein E3O11_06250 [Cryobacterium levicorallinum]